MIEVAEAISGFPQPTGQLITQSMADEELAGLRDELREFTRAENARLNEIKELLNPKAFSVFSALICTSFVLSFRMISNVSFLKIDFI